MTNWWPLVVERKKKKNFLLFSLFVYMRQTKRIYMPSNTTTISRSNLYWFFFICLFAFEFLYANDRPGLFYSLSLSISTFFFHFPFCISLSGFLFNCSFLIFIFLSFSIKNCLYSFYARLVRPPRSFPTIPHSSRTY